jgi:hypothetical protein
VSSLSPPAGDDAPVGARDRVGGTDLPVGLVAAVLGVLVLTALVARRIRFAD